MRATESPWPAARWPIAQPTVLTGSRVTVTTTDPQADSAELFDALDHDAVWRHVHGRPANPSELQSALCRADAEGRYPWTVRRDGVVVGTTSYLEVSALDARLEIGSTAYMPSVWGTAVNPECKLLLLRWAFDVGGMSRVQLKTDVRNSRSRAAITKLGAQFEGVLRRYQRRQDGSIRDTAVYSITIEDWPQVRAHLEERLSRQG